MAIAGLGSSIIIFGMLPVLGSLAGNNSTAAMDACEAPNLGAEFSRYIPLMSEAPDTNGATTTVAASQSTRDARVAAAVAASSAPDFPPISREQREFGEEALIRILTDLQTDAAAHALVIEPASARLPAALARLVMSVTVACSDANRAELLRRQLDKAGLRNVWVTNLAPGPDDGDAGRFDRILVAQSDHGTLGPMLEALLAKRGCAIWPADRSCPPRHMRRLLRVDGAEAVEEELDLVRFMPLLGDMLVENGFVLRQDIAESVQAASQNGRQLGAELLDRGAVREDDLFRVLAEQRGMPFTRTGEVLRQLDLELVLRLPRKFLDHYRFLPVAEHGRTLQVVTTDVDLPVWELQAAFERSEIAASLITPTDLHRIWTAIELGFVQNPDQQLPAPVGSHREAHVVSEEPSIDVEDSRTGGLFDAILLDAVAERASDIHLERYQTGTRLRFRVDGSLRDVDRYQFVDEQFVALINVVKISSGLDIAERRMPQGGRIRRKVHNHSYDLRVQTQPTLFSESMVIRILPQDRRPPSIEELGFQPEAADKYRRLLRDPQGLMLVVGATGSGKSTTIYAGLQMLAKDTSRKVITIEDPIEFCLHDIQQTQVNAAVGYRFAEAVRSFLRQDPDVILVGEIRDSETALEAIRAAQTGHLVLATMHCNDGVDAVQRLADLGMSANSIASELTAVIAQRLARRICSSCRQPALPDAKILAELFPAGTPSDFRCFEGRGCDRCRSTGTFGRVAVVEFLHVGPEIRRAIANQVVIDDLRVLAANSGMQTLRDSVIELVRTGVIPLGEVYDVLSAEQMAPPA